MILLLVPLLLIAVAAGVGFALVGAVLIIVGRALLDQLIILEQRWRDRRSGRHKD